MTFDRGIVYIATDEMLYFAMTLMSIQSFRRAGNNEPIAVITNIPGELWTGRHDLNYTLVPADQTPLRGLRGSYYHRSTLLEKSPYFRTLLVDSDILFVNSINEIWEGNEDLSVAIDPCETIKIVRAAAPRWGSQESWDENIRLVGENGAHYNVGVLRIDRSPNGVAFFQAWKEEINRFTCPDVDQAAFIRAVHRSDIPLKLMDQRFNSAYRVFHPCQERCLAPAIVHFNGMGKEKRNQEMLSVFQKHFG